jgi:two-component system sensor histidine kinase QseC
MTAPFSLKRRILGLALSAITLVWLGAAAFTYFDARQELNNLLDAHLAQASTLVIAQASHELEEIETDHAPLLHKYSRRIAFQVWQDGRELRLHSANAPQTQLGGQQEGFSDATIDGRHWRVFSTWDDTGKLLIHVAEQTGVREALARHIAGNLLLPLALALPVLAVLLWFAVSGGMRPLARLTKAVEDRAPDNLAPLDIASAPQEAVPLIERLNALFVRIHASLENERRFTADAAHELRTPIAAIKAQAQVAVGATDDAGRKRALQGAIAGCDRAAHLIEQLLTLARLDASRENVMEPSPLRALAGEVIAEMAPEALDRNIRMELTEGNEITVRGLPALLRIMLRNMLDNAVRHTPAGTLVSVGIDSVQGRPCMAVSDNGAGLPPEELAKISQRFHRPQGTAASGSGLGLSIVRRIAEIHGAELLVTVASGGNGLRVAIVFSAS